MTGEEIYKKALKKGLKPKPYVDYATWAEKNFYLPKESTKEYGLIRLSRTPWLREPLEELSPQSKTQNVDVVKPTQSGGTTLGLIFTGGIIDTAPAPTLMLMPTDAMARSFSKKRLSKTVAASPVLRGKIADPKSRTSGNEILRKEFPGGDLRLAGSNSQAVYRSEPAKNVILDDFAGFPSDVEGEGAPDQLAERRTGTFTSCKIYINSTPTAKGECNMEGIWARGSQGHFQVPCPRCKEYQYLEFGTKGAKLGIQFERDETGDITDIWYVCRHCGGRIDENEKSWMLARGKYVHKYPERERRGFRWNALYTPPGWRYTWKKIAEEYIAAAKEIKNGNTAPMKTVVNTLFADWWEEPGEKVNWRSLANRPQEQPLTTLPSWVQFLTMGVDTQDNRLAVMVVGWGQRSECQIVRYDEPWGDPFQEDVWLKLDDALFRQWPTEDGRQLQVVSAAIDTGGHRTHAVYAYSMNRAPVVIAIKGSTDPKAPILSPPRAQTVDYGGEKIEDGVYLWFVGTYGIKGTLDARLKLTGRGPGRIHFPPTMSDNFYMQMTGEKLVTALDTTGHPVKKWHQIRPIEARVCWCYAYAAASRTDISLVSVMPTPEPPPTRPAADRQTKNDWFEGMDMNIQTENWF